MFTRKDVVQDWTDVG